MTQITTTGKAHDLVTFSRASGGTALRRIGYGSELVTNGTFDTDSDWTKSAGASISGGVGTITVTAGGFEYVAQDVTYTSGKVYKLTATVNGTSGKSMRLQDNASALGGLTVSNGTVTMTGSDQEVEIIWVANENSNKLAVERNSADGGDNYSFTVDNVSVKEVLFDAGSGTLQLFNHPDNIPRIEYNTDGTTKGLLIEEARTNLFAYSQPESAGFGEIRSSLVTSVLAAPDGNPAEKLVEDSTAASSHQLTTGAVGMSLNTAYTMSWFAKAAERDFIAMNIYSGTTSYWTWFDLSNGTVGTATNSPTTFIEDYGNGWYRCGITVTTAASGTPNTATYIAPSNGVLNYDGDGSSGIYVYGAQLEAGSFATSYIPTSGSTATRSADVCSVAIDQFGYNQSEGTVVVQFENSSLTSGINNRLYSLNDDSSNNRIDGLVIGGSGLVQTYSVDGGVVQTSFNTSDAAVSGEVSAFAVGFAQNDFASVVDGGTIATDTSATIPSVTTLDIGNSPAGSIFNGHIRSIKYYPVKLSNVQLQEITS